MMRPRAAAIAALCMLAAMSAPAMAQDDTVAPQATTATYRDWTLRCDHVGGDQPRRVCEIVQAIRAGDSQAVLAQVVIGRPAPNQPVKLIVQVPDGVWLPANVRLTVDDTTSVTAVYKRCLQLCFADTDLDRDDIDAMKTGTEPATLVFQDGARRTIELPVSLNGFTAALEASLRDDTAE